MKFLFKIILILSKILPGKVIREIKDRSEKLYFRRTQILNLFFWKFCMHEFWQDWPDLKFDKDHYLHNHPQEFWTYIVENGYEERYKKNRFAIEEVIEHLPGEIYFVNWGCFHSIKTLRSFKEKDGRRYCKTLTICKRKRLDWGYLQGYKVIPHEEFRLLKKQKIL